MFKKIYIKNGAVAGLRLAVVRRRGVTASHDDRKCLERGQSAANSFKLVT